MSHGNDDIGSGTHERGGGVRGGSEGLGREEALGVVGGIAVADLDLDPDLDQDLDPDLEPVLDLDPAGDRTGSRGPVLSCRPAPGGPELAPGTDVYALVRLRGRPVATVLTRVPEGVEPSDALVAAYRLQARRDRHARQGDGGARAGGGPAANAAEGQPGTTLQLPNAVVRPPSTTVVVATRERAGQLRRALDSLLAQDHPDFRVLVVDNAPVTAATREMVTGGYRGLVDYVREPLPGLAHAHNRGVAWVCSVGAAGSGSEVVAFTDDDVVADPHWLTALTAPFTNEPRLGCTTGLILPARLTTPAQILLESHGGFGKGFASRLYDPASPPADEPLFPFAAGSFGSGANMAFRTAALWGVGGFDGATGTGTPAKGGDDLYGFVRVLCAGHTLRYVPEALVWHHHRETWQDVRNQAYGYGAGLTAYLTAILVHQPSLLPRMLGRLPGGLAHARAITAARGAVPPEEGAGPAPAGPGLHGEQAYAWPRSLSWLERKGMLYGPVGYLKSRLRKAGTPPPTVGPATGRRPPPFDASVAVPRGPVAAARSAAHRVGGTGEMPR